MVILEYRIVYGRGIDEVARGVNDFIGIKQQIWEPHGELIVIIVGQIHHFYQAIIRRQ